ncbi:site-specific integrase [Acidobacteria bacterium AH-259-G07]|nr:site-specific integrase [Acidobacteria bacterium AH-259-G07]
MKPTDFSVHVTTFLTHYLAAQRNVSPNTIKAYRDVFTLLLRFCRDVRGIAPERLRLEQIDVSLVEAFLDYLEKERRSAPSTRNHRLAALHGFFRYVQSEQPDRMLQCQRILAIPQRRHARPMVAYLSKEELAEILAQPDLSNRAGRRDAVLLSLLYDTGARVQELIDLSAGDVRLDPPAQVRLMGKGRKMRAVPLMAKTVQLLRDHMHENHLDRPEQFDQPLFRNGRGQRLSRSGIRYILQKYVGKARSKRPSLNRTVTPHMFRHTKGMHLLQSGISLEMIRDFLGHVDTKTTQIYARANLEMKRNALERISDPSPVRAIPSWQQNKDLLEWLRSL